MSDPVHPTGADILLETLEREGTRVLFGHPGGAILPFYDALHRGGSMRHVLVRHEQGAAHAADGYARATGRVGVCVATSGPGATNLVTGLATAMMDSVPVVAICGQVPSAVMGTQAFQETDVLGLTMPVTKDGFLVEDARAIPDVVAEAFRLAESGRPGPVVIDVPKDLLASAVLPEPRPRLPRSSPPARRTLPPDPAFDAAARLVTRSRRPVLMVGRGVVISRTEREVHRLAERAHLPVVTTLLGLDAFPAEHPQALGLPGMHGTERANRAIQEADLVLGLGLRFDDRVTGAPDRFAPDADIVHLDVDPAAAGRTIEPRIGLIGDLRDTLPRLAERIPGVRRDEWWDRIRSWERRPESDGTGPTGGPAFGPLRGRQVLRALARRLRATGDLVATDVGQHQMWLAQELLDTAPCCHLTSGGLGTMGYALPAGMGAALGRPDRAVWVVTGDGGFQMTVQELATIAEEGLRIRIAILDNGWLGMVRQWQELFYERRYSATELANPNFVLLARAYGIPAWRVERVEELDSALTWAASVDGPSLLDLRVVREENVFPLVAAGAGLDEMMTLAPERAATT